MVRRALAIGIALILGGCDGPAPVTPRDEPSRAVDDRRVEPTEIDTAEPAAPKIDVAVYSARQRPLPYRVIPFTPECRRIRTMPAMRVTIVDRLACRYGVDAPGTRDWGPDPRAARALRARWMYDHCAQDIDIAREVNLDLADVDSIVGAFEPTTLRKAGCPPPPRAATGQPDRPAREDLTIVRSCDRLMTGPIDRYAACSGMLARRGYAVLGRRTAFVPGCDSFRRITFADSYRDPPPRGDVCHAIVPSPVQDWGAHPMPLKTMAALDLRADCKTVAEIADTVDLAPADVHRIIATMNALSEASQFARCAHGRARPLP